MGDGKFWPLQNRNPWADCHKIQHDWLRPRENPLNQIWYKSIHWELLDKWVKNYVFVPFLFIYILWDSRIDQTGWWIFTRDSSLDLKSRNDVPFGVIKLKFNVKPLFIPENSQILAQNGTWFFIDRKCLTMGVLKSKLPLIIIGSSWLFWLLRFINTLTYLLTYLL